jgi:hypothetical protein
MVFRAADNGAGSTAAGNASQQMLATISQLAANPGVSTVEQDAKDPPVYIGFHGEHEAQGPGTIPASEALAQFYQWSDEERQQWGKRLYSAGFTKNPDDWDAQLEGWKYAVNAASSYYTAAGKHITPWAFMDMRQDSGAAAQPYKGPRTTTSYNLPSKSDAHAAITAMFKDQLGRAPEQGELDKYTSMMLAQYRKNPQTTTTTPTKFGANGEVIDSTSTTSGGFNPQGWLEDQAQGDPEWGAYQAATTYFNALQGAIGAGADL